MWSIPVRVLHPDVHVAHFPFVLIFYPSPLKPTNTLFGCSHDTHFSSVFIFYSSASPPADGLPARCDPMSGKDFVDSCHAHLRVGRPRPVLPPRALLPPSLHPRDLYPLPPYAPPRPSDQHALGFIDQKAVPPGRICSPRAASRARGMVERQPPLPPRCG